MPTFEQLLRERGGFRVSTTTRILPPRLKTSGPRTGAQLTAASRAAGDRFYFAASPIAKFIYSKITDRFDGIVTSSASENIKTTKRKASLMNEAKSILNEHRNQVVEAVLPLFDVWNRGKGQPFPHYADGETLSEPDQHAHDYIVRNVFAMLCKTYHAWLPEFVHADDVAACEQTLSRLCESQSERLESELRNFAFGFRKIVAPS